MNKETQLVDFFKSGFYERFWGWQLNERDSKEIADKSIILLQTEKGHILDWCGGWGRVSRHLAQKGFRITILDFIEKYLDMAKTQFPVDANLTTVLADCRNTPADIQADYALCTFNSVGFLPDQEQLKAFSSLFGALKKKAKVIIDCMNQHFIAKYFKPIIEENRPDGFSHIQKSRFDENNGILESEFILRDETGATTESKVLQQRLYTPAELKAMLQSVGFSVTTMYGDFDGNDLSFDLPHIVVIAEK